MVAYLYDFLHFYYNNIKSVSELKKLLDDNDVSLDVINLISLVVLISAYFAYKRDLKFEENKERGKKYEERPNVPTGIFTKCRKCGHTVYSKTLLNSFHCSMLC